jgi:hypothetical protein
MATSIVLHHRARVAALTRSRPTDDPDLVAARRDLRFEGLAQHIAGVVAEAPPLTDAQIDRLAVVLRQGRVTTTTPNLGGDAE